MSPVLIVPARARLGPLCRLLAVHLLKAGHRLMAWADAPATAPPDPATPRLEFHAEACAVEGALYVDGQFVGRLDGIKRL